MKYVVRDDDYSQVTAKLCYLYVLRTQKNPIISIFLLAVSAPVTIRLNNSEIKDKKSHKYNGAAGHDISVQNRYNKKGLICIYTVAEELINLCKLQRERERCDIVKYDAGKPGQHHVHYLSLLTT